MSNSIPMGKLTRKSAVIYRHKLDIFKTYHANHFVCPNSGEFYLWGALFSNFYLDLSWSFKVKMLNTPQNVPIITCVWIGFFITSFIIFIGKQRSKICKFFFLLNSRSNKQIITYMVTDNVPWFKIHFDVNQPCWECNFFNIWKEMIFLKKLIENQVYLNIFSNLLKIEIDGRTLQCSPYAVSPSVRAAESFAVAGVDSAKEKANCK